MLEKQFVMSKYVSQKDLYKDKAEYYEGLYGIYKDLYEGECEDPTKLNKALELLEPLYGSDTIRMRDWIRKPKVQWNGVTPLEAILAGKCDVVFAYLKRITGGEGW